MANYVPNTVARVLRGVPLDSTYSDTIKFDSVGAQTSYFMGKTKYTYNKLTYQRVNSSVAKPRIPLTIRVPQIADNLYDCNYLMFQNTNYGTKWFYAFIKQVNYIDPGNTEIVYELDHYQTWAFDFEVLPSMVLREHVEDDTPFTNITPEPLSVDLYNVAMEWEGTTTSLGLGDGQIVFLLSEGDIGNPEEPGMDGGHFNGLYRKWFNLSMNGANEALAFIKELDGAGKAESIVSIYEAPVRFNTVGPVLAPVTSTLPKERSTFGGNYTIKNNKLMNFPFRYFKLVSSDGSEVIFYPELVNGAHLGGTIVLLGDNSGGMSFLPNYAGANQNLLYSINCSNNPQCAWNNDVYKNWAAQNSTSNILKGVGGAISILGGIATGNVMGVVGGAMSVGSLVAESQKMSTKPNTASGSPVTSSLMYGLNKIGFIGYEFTCPVEIARQMDDFFDMYGYQVNTVKVPEMDSRESWNYVRTENVVIKGSLPVDSMDRIKRMFNDGIRFWHGDIVGNYSLSNLPVKEVKN